MGGGLGWVLRIWKASGTRRMGLFFYFFLFLCVGTAFRLWVTGGREGVGFLSPLFMSIPIGHLHSIICKRL